MKYGIDTSKWQSGKVDYAKAKQAGIEFVFLRIGYNKTEINIINNLSEVCAKERFSGAKTL